MRFDIANYLFNFIGSRYQWGAEGGFNNGFDCSGLILEGLRSVGLWGKDDASAQMIYNHFLLNGAKIEGRLDIGCLIFFGRSVKEITHIGYGINNYQFIEAGGGDSKSVDKGMVRIRPASWRKDTVAILNLFGDVG
jgi:cell wall-associated NlpC family hydrolase